MVTEEQMANITKGKTDSEGHIRTDNFVWTDDETELMLKQPASLTGSQVSMNMLTFGARYCTMNVEEGNWYWTRSTHRRKGSTNKL